MCCVSCESNRYIERADYSPLPSITWNERGAPRASELFETPPKEASMTGKNWLKGMVAGFVATIVLSALMLMKEHMGLMPQLNPIRMMTEMLGGSTLAVGWIMHFMIGTVLWGTLFAWLDPNLPGSSHWLNGIWFSIGAWLLMMVIMMPMAGAGFFGMNLGAMAPVMTLILHIIYGVVLGAVYGLERPEMVHELQASRRY
jgi:hypothetical protein